MPELGSHSTSDLIPAANLALALLGEAPGHATEAVGLQAKDASVVNNAAFSAALGADAVRRVTRLIEHTEAVAAMSLEALGGHVEAYDERLVALRPHPGALATAAHMRELLEGSQLIGRSERPHDPFSLRCLPQIHGAIRDALAHARTAVEIDLCAVTDNPVVVSDGGDALSGGNFHGAPLGLPLDLLGLAVSELATVSQRRAQQLVLGAIGAGTPYKLTSLPAERLGMLMLPSVAATLVSECRLRTQPASRESIPTDLMEDHVSMAALAGRQVREATLLARRVVAIELMCAAQALDFHGAQLASPAAQGLHAAVRERVAVLDEDRPLDADALLELI